MYLLLFNNMSLRTLAPTLQAFHASQIRNPGSGPKLNRAVSLVELQDLRAGLSPSLYYRILSKMLFFRDNAVLLFLFCIRNA